MLLLTLLPLLGCSEADERAVSTPQESERAVSIPATEPGIRGVIAAEDPSSVRVEANPAEESGSPKAVVRLVPEPAVLYRIGGRGEPEDLTGGHNIRVWFDGPVMESYPVQATAAVLVMEAV